MSPTTATTPEPLLPTRLPSPTGSPDAPRRRGPLDDAELDLIDVYWRAANHLSAGQIYLMDNPLLTESLRPEHVKPRLLGHWGVHQTGAESVPRATQSGDQGQGPGGEAADD